jgi:hypothetical protein
MARTLLTDDVFPVRETELNLSITPDVDAVYYIRSITVPKGRELSKKCTTKERDPQSHRLYDAVDSQRLQNEMLDYCLVRWEGITGNPECTLENKLVLPPAVIAAIVDRAQIGQVTAEEKAASFRQSADVVPVLGR